MRGLIIALIRRAIGIRVRTNEQHIAELERMLSDLVTARDTIDAEITETTKRLLSAQVVRDAIGKQRGQWLRESGGYRRLPDGSPCPTNPPRAS